MEITTQSTGSVKVAKMGKCNCAICGKETNVLGRVQFADMNEVCKDCYKKTSPFFDRNFASVDDYKDHMKQLEDSRKLYDAYFLNNKSAKKLLKKTIMVNPDAALIAFDQKRGGFLMFGGTHFYTVYRLADIESMDRSILKLPEGNKKAGTSYVDFKFHNVAGLPAFRFYYFPLGDYTKMKKFLDKSMGLSGLKGVKNAFNKAKAQGAAIGSMVNAIKDASQNKDDAGAVNEAAQQFAAEQEAFFYAGRESLVEKADAAIAKVLG